MLFKVIDNPHSTTFTFPRLRPSKLSYTTRTRNNFPRFRIPEQEALQTQKFIIGQVTVNVLCKGCGLNEYHGQIIRRCRTNCNSYQEEHIIVYIRPGRSLRGAIAVARRSRSKPGDSSLCSEQAPQSQSEIATPSGLAMTASCNPKCKLFPALRNNSLTRNS